MRTLVAVIVAAPRASLVGSAVLMAYYYVSDTSSGIHVSANNVLWNFGAFAKLGTAFALTAAFTLGMAWHRIALAREWTKTRLYVLAGGVGGLLVPCIVFGIGLYPFDASEDWPLILWSEIVGVFTAWFAWLFRRPDRGANLGTHAP